MSDVTLKLYVTMPRWRIMATKIAVYPLAVLYGVGLIKWHHVDKATDALAAWVSRGVKCHVL